MARGSKKTAVIPQESANSKQYSVAGRDVIRVLADPSFSFEDAIRQSSIDELTLGQVDIGPTDSLDPDILELEYDAFFGTSPLSSPSPSPSTSRSASPTSRTSPTNPTRICSPTIPASILTGNSKTRRNKRRNKIRVRETRKEARANAPHTNYVPRPTTILKHVHAAESTKVDFGAEDFPTASTGFIALPDRDGGKVYGWKYLVEELGFQYVKACPGKTQVIVDKNDLVIVVIIGQREDADWPSVHESAFQSLQVARSRCKFGKKSMKHRRGDFPALNCGISFGGGQEAPGNLCHSQVNSKELTRLVSNPSFKRIAGFASGVFATWAPKLYSHYERHFEALLSRHPHLRRNFRNSVWASVAFNFGPKTVTARHRDFANVPYGLCAVTALGHYNHTKGGHMVLWELKLVVEFPAGSTILLPSASISHSNTPIRRGESRASFTQYSAGGLFRWVEQGFQKKDEYIAGLSAEQKADIVAENQAKDVETHILYLQLRDMACTSDKGASPPRSLSPKDLGSKPPLTAVQGPPCSPTASTNSRSCSKRYAIHPSTLLKSPVLNRKKSLATSGFERTLNLRLKAERLKHSRSKFLKRLIRYRASAEELLHSFEDAETSVLESAANTGQTFNSLCPEDALALARATHQLMDAEEHAAIIRLEECKSQLLVLSDAVDEAHARLDDSYYQFSSLVHAVTIDNLPIDPSLLRPPTPVKRRDFSDLRFRESVSGKTSPSNSTSTEGSFADWDTEVSDWDDEGSILTEASDAGEAQEDGQTEASDVKEVKEDGQKGPTEAA